MELKPIYKSMLRNIFILFFGSAASYFTVSYLLKKLDPTNSDQKKNAKRMGKDKLKKIGQNLNLTEHETTVASHLIVPEDVDISWKDIAGLEDTLQEITETVIFPIKKRHLLSKSNLTRPPKGILLYGPPGCGKTLIAKATAKEADVAFINLDISILTDKWYGESQKLVSALFSLAEKLHPCIIFIDEIDALLRSRSSQDHEATAMMKAQFMFLWDGLNTDNDKIVIVMGATNRPQDLDSAILRRMPSTFKIPMPNVSQRIAILKLILDKEDCSSINYKALAESSDGFSGADLKELCRKGALLRVREHVKAPGWKNENSVINLRSITMKDLHEALVTMTSKMDSYLVDART